MIHHNRAGSKVFRQRTTPSYLVDPVDDEHGFFGYSIVSKPTHCHKPQAEGEGQRRETQTTHGEPSFCKSASSQPDNQPAQSSNDCRGKVRTRQRHMPAPAIIIIIIVVRSVRRAPLDHCHGFNPIFHALFTYVFTNRHTVHGLA